MYLIRLAVELAISRAQLMKCFFAAGLFVLADASLHMLAKILVCLAMVVAASNTCERTQ